MAQAGYYFEESQHLHTSASHPECQDRLVAVRQHLERAPFFPDLKQIDGVTASLEKAELVHSREYLAHLAKFISDGGGFLDPDTYTTSHSLEVALSALGGLLGCTQAVASGDVKHSMALIRPPGHHARPDSALGFCLLSNLAIAVRWAQQELGVGRVLVVDFDVHHGNGTQEAFYDDPDVFFMSIHHAPPFFPGTGSKAETGLGRGKGFTMNIPFPPGVGDEGYRMVTEHILSPAVERFKPELIFVSAGYDAHWRDPLADMRLSLTGFDEMVKSILDWAQTYCDGKVVATLEGGYDLDIVGEGVVRTLGLFNDSSFYSPDTTGPSPFPEYNATRLISGLADFFSPI